MTDSRQNSDYNQGLLVYAPLWQARDRAGWMAQLHLDAGRLPGIGPALARVMLFNLDKTKEEAPVALSSIELSWFVEMSSHYPLMGKRLVLKAMDHPQRKEVIAAVLPTLPILYLSQVAAPILGRCGIEGFRQVLCQPEFKAATPANQRPIAQAAATRGDLTALEESTRLLRPLPGELDRVLEAAVVANQPYAVAWLLPYMTKTPPEEFSRFLRMAAESGFDEVLEKLPVAHVDLALGSYANGALVLNEEGHPGPPEPAVLERLGMRASREIQQKLLSEYPTQMPKLIAVCRQWMLADSATSTRRTRLRS